MQECYLNIPHSVLHGKTPHESYEMDSHELRLLPAETIADAFLSCEQSKVDKGGSPGAETVLPQSDSFMSEWLQ